MKGSKRGKQKMARKTTSLDSYSHEDSLQGLLVKEAKGVNTKKETTWMIIASLLKVRTGPEKGNVSRFGPRR